MSTHTELRARLDKKATFEPSVKQLIELCQAGPAEKEWHGLYPLVARSHVLLKTRYSNPNFWKLGEQLYSACLKLGYLSAEQQAKLEQYFKDTYDAIHAAEQQDAASEAPTLEEILFGFRRQQRRSHFDDTGLIIEGPPAVVTALQQAQQQQEDEQDAAEEGTGAAAAGGGAGPLDPEALLQARLQEAIASGAAPPGTTLDQLMDSMTAFMAEANGTAGPAAGPPPASKKVVSQLPREVLSAARVQELGPGAACPVCTDELKAGDEVQVLPCKHIYHPQCLAPWLSQHNSCPTCRHELPTDDALYEHRKEVEASEREDARGAANALSHNEFMYI